MLFVVRVALTGAVCAVVALTGCSVSVEPKENPPASKEEPSVSREEPMISKEDFEQGIADALEKVVGQRPDSVECPGPVKAKAGESVRCELSAGSVRYGLTATVSSYNNGKAQYEVKVDDEPAD